jgi:hypothetical protein
MSNVIQGDFESDGISIGDRRAIALHEWVTAQGGASADEMKAEMARLRQVMPSPEDNADLEKWPDWFPASPADIERGDELFIGGYTWTLQGPDGPKRYKYREGRWYRV